MKYKDQVRKLYAKVKIIYQDADASYEISAITSSNSKLSFPIQVYQGNISPTVKACTMDGNSTMNGEYQLLGNNCIMGWWSSELSNELGNFTNNPTIELNFIKRPVWKWTIIGDNKLNQFPVDFKLTIFNQNKEELCSKTITNNGKVQIMVKFDDTYTDVKSIKLEIIKWNTPNAVVKILQFFDTLEENYEGNDIKSFEVLESLATDGEGISFGIISNTMTASIYNRNRKFEVGYLKDYLLLGRKVIPYIGIEDEEGNINYEQVGVFLSDEWSVPQNDQWVKLKCFDRLIKFQKMTYIGYPFRENVSLKEITIDILKNAGLEESEFIIDEKLATMVVPYAFLGKKSIWDALQDVCNAGLCRVYSTRENKIKVSVENLSVENSGINIGPDRLFNYEVKTRKTDFSNHVEVDYSDINASLTESVRQVVYSNLISIDANSKRTMIVDFSQNVTNAYLTFLPLDKLKLNFFESSINCAKFELENKTNKTVIANVEISGLVIAVNTQTVVIEDEASIENYGVMAYKHTSSDLVQTYARAVDIANYFMKVLNQGAGALNINWRGDPNLKLEDKFSCTDRFGNTKEYISQSNRFTFSGGLKQETKAREV